MIVVMAVVVVAGVGQRALTMPESMLPPCVKLASDGAASAA